MYCRGKKEPVPRIRAGLSQTDIRYYFLPLSNACGCQRRAERDPSECCRETVPNPSELVGSIGPWTARVATAAILSRWDGPSCATCLPGRRNLRMIRLTFAKLKQFALWSNPGGDL